MIGIFSFFGETEITQAIKKETETIANDNSRKGNWIKDTGKIFHNAVLSELEKITDIIPIINNSTVNLCLEILILPVRKNIIVNSKTKSVETPIKFRFAK